MKLPKQIVFTKEGYEKLQNDQVSLQQERVEAVEHLKKAREMGDLSENGYYKAAKAKLSSIDHQLHRIHYLLRFGKITSVQSTDSVQVGTLVVFSDGSQEKQLQLVGEHEANPAEGKISSRSPIGAALLGKKKNDKISITTPRGIKTYTILSIQ